MPMMITSGYDKIGRDAEVVIRLAGRPAFGQHKGNRRFSFLAGLGGSVPLSMPLGLIVGRPFKPFRLATPSRCSMTSCFRVATSPNSSTSRASSSGRLRSERDGRCGTSVKNLTESSRCKRKMRPRPRFFPSYLATSAGSGIRRNGADQW
jgi:hypothetical protein